MFKHIMVPLDGSELAERALPCAEQLAVAADATLHLVRVVEPQAWLAYLPFTRAPTGTPMAAPLALPATLPEDLRRAESETATAYLDAQREQRTLATGVAVQAEVLSGHVAATLLDYEREAAVDLVVMCSHGRSGLARFTLGSVADRLLRHGRVPLLLVRAFGAPVRLQHAVVPLDGSERAETALHLVPQLAPQVISEVTLLRVIAAPEEAPDAERYLAETAGRLQQTQVAWHSRVEQGDAADQIIAVAGADKLVVMATHGRTGLTRWALGSVADRVTRGGVAGVMLVRTAAGAPQP